MRGRAGVIKYVEMSRPWTYTCDRHDHVIIKDHKVVVSNTNDEIGVVSQRDY